MSNKNSTLQNPQQDFSSAFLYDPCGGERGGTTIGETVSVGVDLNQAAFGSDAYRLGKSDGNLTNSELLNQNHEAVNIAIQEQFSQQNSIIFSLRNDVIKLKECMSQLEQRINVLASTSTPSGVDLLSERRKYSQDKKR
ncbi:hypothetical protein Avbf_06469 [Armadillidium vulgare]|nr:hypothetical protein Avbf_06469 [Armadillidium vulgare]